MIQLDVTQQYSTNRCCRAAFCVQGKLNGILNALHANNSGSLLYKSFIQLDLEGGLDVVYTSTHQQRVSTHVYLARAMPCGIHETGEPFYCHTYGTAVVVQEER